MSHDLDAVERWCDEALWLHAGRIADRGEPRRVIDAYRQFLEQGEERELFNREEEHHVFHAPMAGNEAGGESERGLGEGTAEMHVPPRSERQRWGSREIEITSVELLGENVEAHRVFHPEESMTVAISYRVRESVPTPVFGIGIHRGDGLVVHGSNTDIERSAVEALSCEGVVYYKIHRLSLGEGAYWLDVAVHRADGYPYDYHRGALHFAVRNPLPQLGVLVPAHEWIFSRSGEM